MDSMTTRAPPAKGRSSGARHECHHPPLSFQPTDVPAPHPSPSLAQAPLRFALHLRRHEISRISQPKSRAGRDDTRAQKAGTNRSDRASVARLPNAAAPALASGLNRAAGKTLGTQARRLRRRRPQLPSLGSARQRSHSSGFEAKQGHLSRPAWLAVSRGVGSGRE